MNSLELILSKLTEAVSGTDKQLFTKEELNEFANFYFTCNKNTSKDEVAELFVDFWWNTDKECRRCSVCGKLMRKGYCIDAGTAYYCCDNCLHTEYSEKEWEEKCKNNDQSYYTEWGNDCIY